MVLFKIFNRRWWWTTLLVIAGVIVLIRLGFWQLDRLEQRRDFNATVAARWTQTPFDLNQNPLPAVLDDLEYRRIQVSGEFDYTHQIVLTQQTRDSIPGAVLVTPLVYADNQAVLVARGWVPANRAAPEHWAEFEERVPLGRGAPVIGLIQESQMLPTGQPPSIPDAPQREWFRLNIDAVQPQMPYTLLPVFIYQLPEEGRAANALPYRTEPLALDEGSHFSYAIQWFMFALILGGGYFFFIEHIETREKRLAAEQALPPTDADGAEEDDPTAQPEAAPGASSLASPAHPSESAHPVGIERDLRQIPPQKGHA